ncbi:tetratricopeptide (TPR) repeat protein [Kitasatospora sp. MAP12-15]|uniref:tetratricopeptide repeat protein n=1 Tax=unclassified Kitasatospora TaxID=2633591 RepID=UPI0024754A27|nr:tetratricopeptide repeat protein [Kitasatospora sp. MAP12-44]MDH6111208.1 tetratricopeptide (TPR) repeat protein [Kitasatospora sp. MAP12-44]
MTLTAQRIAAVRAASQGSGLLLSARLILTAAHLLPAEPAGPGTPPEEQIEAAVPGGRGWVRCAPLWRSDRGGGAPDGEVRPGLGNDVALLLAAADLVRPGTAERFEELRWGRIDSSEPVPLCHATGYPAATREDGGVLRSHQLIGTLAPGSAVGTGRHVLSTLHQPPGPVTGAQSPWSGMSGAPVLFNGLLLGLATADLAPGIWHHSQLGLVALAPLLSDPSFAAVLARHLDRDIRVQGISPGERADAEFEEHYARSIRKEHGRLKIFGLPQSQPWALETAYLSLEAVPAVEPESGDREPSLARPAQRQRVERMLKGRHRVLLRGQAGSGKTTLLQWLAVTAVGGGFAGELADFNYRVPFVLRLRTMFQLRNLRPRPADFLAIDRSRVADSQPHGWAERVFESGRAVLLVDGLDEVPQQHREEAEEWLAELLDDYPRVFTLVTVRPSAVPPRFLRHLRFDELTLCPMNEWDRTLFVERWHQAALAAEADDAEDWDPADRTAHEQRFREMKNALLRTLDRSPELDALTDSPLLCAMICALHREWEGAPPHRTMEVYESALNMLLVRRDKQRRVAVGPLGEQLGREEQLALLQRVAAWLVANGQTEGGRSDALRQIGRVLPSLPAAHRGIDAEQVFRHLLERTGLLAETSVETFEFVHRTFQDYLAAREFMEDRDFGLLADRAADEQWADVVRMGVGHCSPRDRVELLHRLLAAADARSDPREARWIRLVAATCLPYASVLDEPVQAEVLDQLVPLLRMFPTEAGQTYEAREWHGLYAIGEALLPLLTPSSDLPVWLVCRLLERIGGEEALRRLAAIDAQVADAGEPAALASREVLARAYQEAGDLDREIPTLEQIVTLTEQLVGRGHPDAFSSRLRLADARLEAGDLAGAVPSFEQLLADAEGRAGPADLLVIRGRLGEAYLQAGALSLAIPLFERLREETEALLGPEHPHALAARGSLATALRDAGSLARAITMFEWLVVDAEQALGEDHPETLTIRTARAVAYAEAGDAGQSIAALEQLHLDAVRVLGEDFPATLTVSLRLAIAYAQAGDLFRAVPILEAVNLARTRVLGEHHPASFAARRHLAVGYLEQGDHALALSLLEVTLVLAGRVLGPQHPEILALRHELAVARRRTGEPGRAAAMLARIIDDRGRLLGPAHPDTLRSRHELAKADWALGNPYQAIALAERTLALCEDTLSPGHPLTIAVRESLRRG